MQCICNRVEMTISCDELKFVSIVRHHLFGKRLNTEICNCSPAQCTPESALSTTIGSRSCTHKSALDRMPPALGGAITHKQISCRLPADVLSKIGQRHIRPRRGESCVKAMPPETCAALGLCRRVVCGCRRILRPNQSCPPL